MAVSKIQNHTLVPPKPAEKPKFGDVLKSLGATTAAPAESPDPTPLRDNPAKHTELPGESADLPQTADTPAPESTLGFEEDIAEPQPDDEPQPLFSPEGLAQAAPEPALTAPTPTEAARSTEVIQHVAAALAAEGWCGTDATGRKVVMLRVTCPGHGQVRIRLRQDADGIHIRLRPETDELAQLLQANQDQLGQTLAQKGMNLAQMEVIR